MPIRGENSIEVNVDGHVDVAAIASGHHDGDRDRQTARAGEHTRIALCQHLRRELQSTEAVVFVRVRTGEIDQELRSSQVGSTFERLIEGFEVILVIGAIGQLDIHGVILRKDRRCAVTLMDVEIDDQYAIARAIGLHSSRGDRNVIEQAIACAAIAVRMMGATGKIDADPFRQRYAADGERCSD